MISLSELSVGEGANGALNAIRGLEGDTLVACDQRTVRLEVLQNETIDDSSLQSKEGAIHSKRHCEKKVGVAIHDVT